MVLRIYWILIAIGIIGLIIVAIFQKEDEKGGFNPKYVKFIDNAIKICDFFVIAFAVIFVLYNLFVVGYCIAENHYFFIVIPCLFLMCSIFGVLSEKVRAFDFLTNILWGIFFACWLIYLVMFSLVVFETPIKENDITQNCDLVNTIDILEFTQTPYNNITGARYYIKSAPSNAYYYEIRTDNGGTTTKVIDGSSNYVEKFVSDEYINNPHIDVYRNYTIEHYISWYGNEVTKETSSSYSYFIYIPENSIFCEVKSE